MRMAVGSCNSMAALKSAFLATPVLGKSAAKCHGSSAHLGVAGPRLLCSVAGSENPLGRPGQALPSGLILPGSGSVGGFGGSSSAAPSSSPYLPFLRPPSPSEHQLSTEEIISILEERRGLWYEYAPYIGQLIHRGLNPPAIAEATGIEGAEQSTMMVAAQVHSTLRELGCATLDYFDKGGAEVLYELRILSGGRRREAAEYVARQALDAKGAREVARAMKEYERRRREEGWESFSPSPADCLAYVYYRQSGEVRGLGERISALEKALSCAETESATHKLRETLQNAIAPRSQAQPRAISPTLSTVRLRRDESYPKPVVVIGNFGDLSPSSVLGVEAAAGVTRREGPFEIFEVQPKAAPGSAWMALPAWPALDAAAGPLAAMVLDNPDTIPALRGKHVQGPLVLVVDLAPGQSSSASHLYVVGEGDRLAIVDGDVDGPKLGRVVVAVLPPKEEAEQDYELDD